MKNLITFCVIVLTTTLMLSSCGSSLSITKRHYNKGYYISHNHVKSNNKTIATDKVETSDTEVLSEKEKSQTTTNSTEENVISTNAFILTDEADIVESESSLEPKTKKATPDIKEHKELIPAAIKTSASKFKSVYSDSKSKYAPAEGEALSLLWIIIIVLLILWLLGFLGGYGTSGLIHLLLVIALILLILWLLRII